MNPHERIGSWIRATNRNGYRYGSAQPWGLIMGILWQNRPSAMPRQCYEVYFPPSNSGESSWANAITDIWPVLDPSDPYEFVSLRQEAL